MKPKVGQYCYDRRDHAFRIYRYISVTETGSVASPVQGEKAYFDSEEARKRVYELNGWRYKG